MEDLVTYWRREGQHLEAAKACGDEITVEYATKARETANEIERLRASNETMSGLIHQMLDAIELGGVDSQQLDGEPENNIPPRKWHEEWEHYARNALSQDGKL